MPTRTKSRTEGKPRIDNCTRQTAGIEPARICLCFRVFLLLMCVAGLPHQATSQFYAPSTDYHDAVQRVFPVEAARLLAARENFVATVARLPCHSQAAAGT